MFTHELVQFKDSLSFENMQQLAELTSNYSCADIATVLKDVMYQPIRRSQSATHFKPVGEMYTACAEDEDGAVAMRLEEVPGRRVIPGPIHFIYFESALTRCKSNATQQDIQQFEEWTQLHGQQ